MCSFCNIYESNRVKFFETPCIFFVDLKIFSQIGITALHTKLAYRNPLYSAKAMPDWIQLYN